MNKHCYIQSVNDKDIILKRSVELKHEILETLFGWKLHLIDEDEVN